ncbi:MAG: hypothetical protein RR922_00995 [Clostridia bacterium]
MTLESIAMVVAFVVTTVIAMIGIPILRKKKIGQVVREDGPRSHIKKNGTPTMGGIFIILTVVIVGRSIKCKI